MPMSRRVSCYIIARSVFECTFQNRGRSLGVIRICAPQQQPLTTRKRPPTTQKMKKKTLAGFSHISLLSASLDLDPGFCLATHSHAFGRHACLQHCGGRLCRRGRRRQRGAGARQCDGGGGGGLGGRGALGGRDGAVGRTEKRVVEAGLMRARGTR